MLMHKQSSPRRNELTILVYVPDDDAGSEARKVQCQLSAHTATAARNQHHLSGYVLWMMKQAAH